MMTLGTTAAFGFEEFPQPHITGLYVAAGCSVVQVYRNRLRNMAAGEILALLKDLPIRVDSLHGHFGDDLDPSSENESVRRASVEAYRPEAEYCRALGGDLVVIHPSPGKPEVKHDGRIEQRFAQLHKSFDELARIAEQAGVRFAFENMPPYHPVGNDAARLVREVVQAGTPRIVFLLDTGHAHMNSGLTPAIRAAGPHLSYTHVHDNDGRNDTHILPYRGTIAWDECGRELKSIGYKGIFLLEVFESAADLKKLLNETWKSNILSIVQGSG